MAVRSTLLGRAEFSCYSVIMYSYSFEDLFENGCVCFQEYPCLLKVIRMAGINL